MAVENQNSLRICGIDEAGRGALAGPLVAAAVVLTGRTIKTVSRRAHLKARDGKLLSPDQRSRIYKILKNIRTEIAVEIVSARSINNHGIGWANREIMRRLVKRIPADLYILDGNLKIGRVNGKKGMIRSVVNADATIPAVILAGIVAKVERDKLMQKLHRRYPQFHWNKNKGYGTRDHLTVLQTMRISCLHRRIFVTTALNS